MQIPTFKKHNQIIIFMQKTKSWAIGLVLIATFLITIAQICWKFAANSNNIITNPYLWFGFITYALTAILLIIALKHGELSVLSPLNSTSFIWVNLASAYFFLETITTLKWTGIIFILLGVSLIATGGTK